MSKDLANRHRTQAAYAVTGATLGLSALGSKAGAVGARQIIRRAPGAAQRLRLTARGADMADKASLGLVTTGAGVGGVGGLHFAALQRAEAKKEDKGRSEVGKSAFGVVHKAVFDLDKKREERDLAYAKMEGQKADRRRHQAMLDDPKSYKGILVGQERVNHNWETIDRDDAGNEIRIKHHRAGGLVKDETPHVPKAPQTAFKKTPRAALPPKRTKWGGVKLERKRQDRMSMEQHGLEGAAVGAAGASGGLALVARGQKRKAADAQKRIGRNDRLIARSAGRKVTAAGSIEAINAKKYEYKARPGARKVHPQVEPEVFERKPYAPGPGDPAGPKTSPTGAVARSSAKYKANLAAHEAEQDRLQREHIARQKNIPKVNVVEEIDRAKAGEKAFNTKQAAARAPHEHRIGLANSRSARLVERNKGLTTVARVAGKRARVGTRASVVAGGTALALGAGALGVRHMRRNQGKTYTDWWDG